jgi:hypothetical protein
MKRRWVIFPALLLVAGLAAMAFFLVFHKEPEYEGRTARDWLKDWPGTPWYQEEEAPKTIRTPLAVTALQTMGADVVPWVRRELNGYSDWKTYFTELADRFRKKTNAVSFFGMENVRPQIALDALAAIGPPAQAAVPDVVEVVRHKTNEFNLRTRAVITLGAIRSRAGLALPPLIECLNNESGPIQDYAVRAVSRFGKEARPYLEDVRIFLARHPTSEGIPAAELILRIDPDDGVARQLLTRQMTNNFDIYRLLACETLGRVGTNAAWAVPLLEQALKDDNARIRSAATNGLVKLGRLKL